MSKRKIPEKQGKAVKADSQNLPLQPNMLLSNMSATSSTFDHIDLDHCVFNQSEYFNSLFAQSSVEGATFNYCNLNSSVIENSSLRGVQIRDCNLNSSVIENSSLRGVQIRNCDINGLIVNGIDIGKLMLQLKQIVGA